MDAAERAEGKYTEAGAAWEENSSRKKNTSSFMETFLGRGR
jgi:hypothetical protein